MSEWSLFSNHGHVLVCLANNQQARLRDVAAEVGITERAVQNILRELQVSGVIQITKHGRCNHYQIDPRKSLRHPLVAHCTVGSLLQLLKSGADETSASEVLVEHKPRARTRAAAKPAKIEPAAVKPAQQPAAQAAEVESVKPQAATEEPIKAEAAKVESVVTQPSKNTEKDKKKKVSAADQQGSLF